MRIIRLGALLAMLGLLMVACAPSDVTADEIMQRMQKARDMLNTAHAVADVTLDSPSQPERSGSFTIESWTKKTDKTDAAGKPITKLRAKVLNASGGDADQVAEMIGTEFVNDGETFWLYTPKGNKVVTGKLSELKNGDVSAQDPTAQMMQMQQQLQQLIDGSNVVIQNKSEQVAGRETWKIKLTPKPETQQTLQLGSMIDTNLWVDKGSDLPVKALIDAKDLGKVEATATTLDLNQPIADAVFTFTPPAGATIINAADIAKKARPQTTTLDNARKQVSFTVLTPSTLPSGVQLDEVQVLNMRGETVVQNYSGTASFSVVQGKGGFPGADSVPDGAQATQVKVRGHDATLITGGASKQQGTLLRWQENNVTIVIAGTLSNEQALALAETLK
jgi:outer membrane lipoprotein-sorting protein